MAERSIPTDPIDVVEQFCAALERFDLDAAMELVHEEIVYQNVPFPPARGHKQFRGQMEGFKRFADLFEIEMHNIAADGPVVLTERTDVGALEVAAAAPRRPANASGPEAWGGGSPNPRRATRSGPL